MSAWESASNGVTPKMDTERQKTGISGQTTQQKQASTHFLTSQFLPTNVTLLQEHLLLGSGQEATDEEIRSKFQASQMLS